ncbi:DUF6311 domain-containing protein [Sphingomonas sp.]|uniref:DUF6311 domain-containing protein n=1 Tax=Sphingomonas sp. TaxID=28214 RepID=UPI001B021B73|nr:DUF6311 domain-containing protein [Sphingomonas sp.]MBO9714414.1 hypothetical protein [Sphingomonas sp.]
MPRPEMRAFLPRLPLLLLPLALFLALFHPATLDPSNAGWLIRGTDNGENALGTHAWLHDPAPGLLRTHLLNAPEGVPLLFTDSNPLVGAVLKPFAPLLPENAQVVGPWILLCFFLQVFFAWKLLEPFAPNRLALWTGVFLLAALPTLANRYIHANLMAHWLILWALRRFLDPRRAGDNRGWAVLIAITATVHSYLLVMVGAIWASAMLERFHAGDRRERTRLAIGSAAILAMVVALAWLLGAIGEFDPAGNYGAFAMPIDALWNPANPGWSRFLPAIEQRPGRGFEGFQYLGFGLLLLMPVALYARRSRPAPEPQRKVFQRLRWLVPALAVLTLLAISNFPDFAGHALPRLPLPQSVLNALDAVRASGRLFWPVAYVLVFAALLAAYRLPRAPLILAALAAVQIVDLSGMTAAVRAASAEAGRHRLYVRTLDPRWDAVIASARDITLVPPDPIPDLALFQEVAWRAANHGRPVRLVYAARDSRATKARLAAEQFEFVVDNLAPGRLYIVAPGYRILGKTQQRVVLLDGVKLILPEDSRRTP